jgi:hypothetical protein
MIGKTIIRTGEIMDFEDAAKTTNASFQEMGEMFDEIGNRKATDLELSRFSFLVEASNFAVNAWIDDLSKTDEGFEKLQEIMGSPSEVLEDLNAPIEDLEQSYMAIWGEAAKANENIDINLVKKMSERCKDFINSHDHCSRVIV